MKFVSKPTFRQALIINQTPIWLLAILAVGLTGMVMGEIDSTSNTLIEANDMGRLQSASIQELGEEIRLFWLGAFTFFLVMSALAVLLSVWLYSTVARRLDSIVEYAEARAAGNPVAPLQPEGSDPVAKLEAAIVEITEKYRERDEELRRETALTKFDGQLQRAFDLSETESQALDVLCHAMQSVMPMNSAEVMLADSSKAHLRKVGASSGDAPGCPVERPMDCAALRIGQTLRFESSNDIDACPWLRRHTTSPCSAVCAPLNVMGTTIGVIHVTGEDTRTPPDEDVRRLEATAMHAGTRLSMLRTLATTQVQAQTDSLTGLLNRRSFEENVVQQLAVSPNGKHCVVMCDLDHFKRLNDTFGHEAGDRALKLFAQTARNNVRPNDVVGRHGGEEFVMFLTDCEADGARTILDRFRRRLATATERYNGPDFTASFGVATYPQYGVELSDLIREADSALYEAKRTGRNRVVAGEDELAPTPVPEELPSLRAVEAKAEGREEAV